MSGSERRGPRPGQAVSALRRLQMREMPDGPEPLEASCDLCGTSMPEDHRHLLQLDERRIVCVVRGAAGPCARATPSTCPPARASCGSRTSRCRDELWARFRIPIGLAFFLRGRGGGVVALYPSPAGATESRARPRVVGRARALNPVLESSSRGRGADRGPHGGAAAVRDRSDRQAYRLVGLIKANWQGISGGPAVEQAVDGFFEELGERVSAVERDGRAGRAPRARVLGARRRAGAARAPPRRSSFSMRVRDYSEREVYTIALTAQIQVEARQRPHDDEPRASACSSCSASPSAGATPRAACSGRSCECWCRASPARPGSSSRCRAPPTSSWPPTRTSPRCPTANVPLAFHFSGTVIYAAGEDRLQIRGCPWHSRRSSRCRSRPGATARALRRRSCV